jgi:NADH-quinone oxidoreductase subunit C
MPDAPGLELIAGELRDSHPGSVLATYHEHGQPCLIVDPEQVLAVLRWLRDTPAQHYDFLASLHGVDYLPATPRFGVVYELLNRDRVERLRVRAALADPSANGAGGHPPTNHGTPGRIRASSDHRSPSAPSEDVPGSGSQEAAVLPAIDSCVGLFPTAEFHEREVYEFFGIVFRGHPDLRRLLLPEVYVGWPLRRDFPIGGEPVIFTHDERIVPGWTE